MDPMSAQAASAAGLLEALSQTVEDPAVAAHEVGASAAQLGDPLDDVLAVVESAYLQARATDPEYRVVRAAITGWSAQMALYSWEISCEDPLTTLATPAHLRSRIEDAYRVAASRRHAPEVEYALVVLQQTPVPRPLALETAMDGLRMARILRGVFDADETIAPLAPHRFGVLVHRSRQDRVADLRARCVADGTVAPVERIWTESLPPRLDDVAWLLSELGR